MNAKEIDRSNTTTEQRNGPPHNNSNGAAIGGPASQVQGVGHGAGGPGDGQGPGLGAGQGQPQSEPAPATDSERNGPPHNNSNGAAVGGPANQVQGVGHGAGGPGDGQGPGLGAGQGQPQSEPAPKNPDGTHDSEDDKKVSSKEHLQDSDNSTPAIHPEPPANAFETQTDDSNDSNDQTQTPELTKDTIQHSDNSTLAIHPEPPANTFETQTDDSNDSNDQTQTTELTKDTNQHSDNSAPAIHPEPPANAFETQTDDSNDSNDQAQSEDQPHHISSQASNNTPDATPEPTTTAIHQQHPAQAIEAPVEDQHFTTEQNLLQNNGLIQIHQTNCNNTTLQIDLTADSGNINRLAFVKVDYDPLTGVSINGEKANNSDAFRQLIQSNLVDPNGSAIHIGGQTERTILWDLDCGDAGHYAPIMITKSGNVLTMGSAADGREHVVVTGGDTFGFEDLMSNQNSDWDYNDLMVKLTEI